MNDNIIQFVKNQQCASICCTGPDGHPHCFSCFFAFNPDEGLLYFKTSAVSHHAVLMLNNPVIAGTILPDKLQALAVKGIQFSGYVLPILDPGVRDASKRYHRRYPFALVMPGEVWTIQLTHIKMTDSTIGIGKSIIWEKEEAAQLA